MPTRLQRQLAEPFHKRINRAPSPLIASTVPWITIMLGSVLPSWPMIASAPVLPPLGFMFLLAWRQLRPGLLPVWGGLPLGLFDDLYSGQPFGSAMLLWSIAMIIMELIEERFPWRNFVIDWLVAAAMVGGYLLLCLTFANTTGGHALPSVLTPQLVLSILVFPLVGRLVAWFDRMRLLRFRSID